MVCGPVTGASMAKPSGSGAIWGAGGVGGAFKLLWPEQPAQGGLA